MSTLLPVSPPPGPVFLFGTCLADAAFPGAGLAALKLIRRLGYTPDYPLDQGCCGQPAYNSGFPEQARAVALKQIEAFRGDAPVVVPSGSCAGMMRRHYPTLFEGHPRLFEALSFAGRVRELFEFLHAARPQWFEDAGAPVTVAWHGSCHARTETGCDLAARAILGSLASVTLVEPGRGFECCGFGGTFSVKRPEVSAAMARDKVEDILATGADILLTADCGCLMNIACTARRMGAPLKAMHLAEFLLERTGG